MRGYSASAILSQSNQWLWLRTQNRLFCALNVWFGHLPRPYISDLARHIVVWPLALAQVVQASLQMHRWQHASLLSWLLASAAHRAWMGHGLGFEGHVWPPLN
jgi:hypothetical protein